MSRSVSIVLVGIGGYGENYLKALLAGANPDGFQIAGAVDPALAKCSRLAELRAGGIPVFTSLPDFYACRHADLAIVSSPIQFHCEQTCLALANGSSVLCEKPLGGSREEVLRIIEARDAAPGTFVSIGYQWSFSNVVQALKGDIGRGLFGRPVRLKTIHLSPRRHSYYARNAWAGRKRAAGRGVLDSPANNADAHYLHNMFYVLGAEVDRSAVPVSVTAELYRANDIENYDTCAMRARVEGGAELLFFASHAVREGGPPTFVFEFEKGVVRYPGSGAGVVADLADGSTRDYGIPPAHTDKKIWDAIESVRTGAPTLCGPEAAASQTHCICAMQASMPDIVEMPGAITDAGAESGPITFVEGLGDALTRCFDEAKLPSELRLPWARPGRRVDLDM